jgi:hypothetical protein
MAVAFNAKREGKKLKTKAMQRHISNADKG